MTKKKNRPKFNQLVVFGTSITYEPQVFKCADAALLFFLKKRNYEERKEEEKEGKKEEKNEG